MNDKKAPDSFASRMKDYEAVAQSVLMQRTPVIIRVDGKNFSKLTRSMEKPFDRRLFECMQSAALRLVGEAQNCRLAYFQSDEISLLLTDFRTLNSERWFGNQVQKLCSISAALATVGFCEEFTRLFPDRVATGRLPVFDARCFNLPREEVANYFIWRQRDCERNSVSMAAQAQFSHKELQGLNRTQLLDLLMMKKGINWNDYDAPFKRGCIITRQLEPQAVAIVQGREIQVTRSRWVTSDAPIFARDPSIVNDLLREEEVRT